MKIIINYDCEDHNIIRGVRTLDYWLAKNKTEQQIDEAIAKRNAEVGWELYKTMEVTDEMANIFRFMLGENEYKTYADITDVYDKLRNIQDDLDSMRDDVFHMSEWVDSAAKKVEALVPEEDK